MADVVFRRIRGRLIPIKREKLEGAGMVAGGLGVAAASGNVAARLVRSAAHAENEARTVLKAARKAKAAAEQMGPLFASTANKKYLQAGHEALKTMVESRKLFASSLGIRNAGYTAGAALIAGGLHRAAGKKQSKKTTAAIAAGAGVATHFAIRSSFLKSTLGKGIKVSDALRAAAKTIIVKRFAR